jgi:hypothetical protein
MFMYIPTIHQSIFCTIVYKLLFFPSFFRARFYIAFVVVFNPPIQKRG